LHSTQPDRLTQFFIALFFVLCSLFCLPGDALMLKIIEGIFRNGKIELLETPDNIHDGTRVLITFLPPSTGPVDLASRGIDPAQAADLRVRLRTFAADWERTEMDDYDDYERNAAAL
jgi:hypothetical protein